MKMRAFGSLRIASIIAILFLSLAECMPNKEPKGNDYLDDGEYDEDSTIGNDDDDPTQPADSGPTGPIHVRSKNMTFTVKPGDSVEFPCIVDNAEDIAMSWSRDNELLFVRDVPQRSNDPRFTYTTNNFSLVLRNVTETDASYSYRCQILVKPQLEISHKLHFAEKPRELLDVIRVKPDRRIEVNENESVTFGCETSIEPKPQMIWSYKGVRLHSDEFFEVKGNYMTIKTATRQRAGRYQCLSENGSKKPPHDAIEVIVKYKPEIEVKNEIVHTGTGMKSELTCIVYAHPRAKVTWHKNFNPINEKSGRRFVDEKTHRNLVIDHTSQKDFGSYTCTAKNEFGEASRTIELTGAPSPPRFHGGEVGDDETSFIIKWHVESYAPIIEYKLAYRRKDETEWTMANPRVTNGRGNQFSVEHKLTRLQPGSYEAKLMAKNEYGWSQYSTPHTFREEYRSEEARIGNSSAITIQPLLALTALLVLAVSSYES